MQVTVEDFSSVKKMLHIEIPEEDVAIELDNAYKQIKKTAKVKGFRPGKVPRNVLERLFKKNVHSDVSSKLMQNSMIEAIKETKLDIIGNPIIEPPDLDKKGPLKFDAIVEIKPEVGTIDYKGLNLQKTLYKVSDEEIDGQVQMLRKQLAEMKDVEDDRPVKEGDFVIMDYEGYKDGKPAADIQKTENYKMKIGDAIIAKELDSELIGMKPSDAKEIKVLFAEDHFHKELAGNEIVFKVNLKKIMKEVLPEVDDEFVKKLGEYNTLEELKKTIRANLSSGYEKRVEQELHEQIFNAIIAKVNFELPDTMVDYELSFILQDIERSFAQHNMTIEQLGGTKEDLENKYRATAEKQVQRHLILEKVIQQDNLMLSEEELEKGFTDLAESIKKPVEEMKEFYAANKDKFDVFKHALLEKKALTLMLEDSNIEEVEPEQVKE